MIKFIAKNSSGCDWHRLYAPLNEFPNADTIKMGVYEESEDPEDCDIYMFNRDINMSPEELMRLKKERGFKIVVDIDDFWILPPSHFLYQPWNENNYGEKMLSFIKIADLVTTTNTLLAERIKLYNSNVFVYPNGISFESFNKSQGTRTRFGYVGGITHKEDTKLLINPFAKANTEKYIKNNAEFVLCGYEDYPEWDSIKTVFEASPCYKVFSSLPLTHYMEHYNQFDVALIPLVDNTFNRCKSSLKIVEASSKGLPCIVSNVCTYHDFKDAPGVLWVNKNADWLTHIRYCIKNPNWIIEQGQALHEWGKERFDIKHTSKQLYDILYNNIL